jgi:N-methylhydantoinase B
MIYTCVLSALGRLNPARAVAPSGLVTGAVSLGYRNRPKPLVHYELAATGLGGTSQHDGTPIVHPMNHFTAGSPVEVVETEYPVLVRRYDIWTDSAGAGRTRGGIGTVRELQVQEDCLLTLRSSGHRSAAWGLAGGEGPAVSRTTINPGTAGEQKLAAIDTRELKAGDVLRIERSGGAGCGAPRERDPDAVRRDVADGYVSREAARERYGVAVDP